MANLDAAVTTRASSSIPVFRLPGTTVEPFAGDELAVDLCTTKCVDDEVDGLGGAVA
jgi:hypothetical protein